MISSRLYMRRCASVLAAWVAGLFAITAPFALPALASPPEGSAACVGKDRLPSGDYTQRSEPSSVWKLVQKNNEGKDVARTFNVYVPPKHEDAGQGPLPLVIDFHSTLAGAWLHDLLASRMRDKGRRAGFIVLQPDSLPFWTGTVADVEGRKGVSDVDFIRRLLAQLDTPSSKLCFDRNRIFATGWSSGSWMSTVIACAAANDQLGPFKIAAIAPVGGGPGEAPLQAPICPELKSDPVPMRVIVSDNDKIGIFAFNGEDQPGANAKLRHVVEAWARANGCRGPSTKKETGQTGWGVLKETVTYPCAELPNGRADTVLDIFDTGAPERNGHFWPGGAQKGAYPTTDVIWDFFLSHPR
jgi:poly(3-hydroxybutyrate) depolymerase